METKQDTTEGTSQCSGENQIGDACITSSSCVQNTEDEVTIGEITVEVRESSSNENKEKRNNARSKNHKVNHLTWPRGTPDTLKEVLDPIIRLQNSIYELREIPNEVNGETLQNDQSNVNNQSWKDNPQILPPKEERRKCISDLSQDELFVIFSFMNKSEILSFSETCRAYNNLTREYIINDSLISNQGPTIYGKN